MQNLRPQAPHSQPPPAEAGPSIIETATQHLWRSIRDRGADVSSLPRDAAGRYLVVWPGAPGCRNQLVLEAGGPVEAAAEFAAGYGWPRPRFFGRLEASASNQVLYVKTGEAPHAFLCYVMAASPPAARAVSAYLRRAEALHPDCHGGFLARMSSPFVTAKTVVVERVPMEHGYAQRCILDAAFSDRTAAAVAAILNADLRMSREIAGRPIATGPDALGEVAA